MLRRCRKSICSKPATPVDTTLIIEFNDRSHLKKKEDLSCLKSCTDIHAFRLGIVPVRSRWNESNTFSIAQLKVRHAEHSKTWHVCSCRLHTRLIHHKGAV